ncbi:MAG: DUF3082 domain-containing protein [Microcystaceae cyanobacterium]
MSSSPVEPSPPDVTPLRCLLGASISGALAYGIYLLTQAIAITFATKPLISDNLFVQRIGAAVRTLVLGVASLGTFIFGFVAIGLILLALQLSLQALGKKTSPPTDS